jgi:hypothetical protein
MTRSESAVLGRLDRQFDTTTVFKSGITTFCSTLTPVADCERVQGPLACIIYVADFAPSFLGRDQVTGKLK